MTAYEQILERLGDRVTSRRDSQAEARCPAHEDRRASLGVGLRRDGEGAVIHCQAGCAAERVMGALGLPNAALFDRHWANGNSNGHRREVAAYDYVDAHGRLLYQVVRFEPKDFRQRQPDGRGGWVWNLKGVKRVLYRLPQVTAATARGGRVFVVEGEKDVHALEAAGEVATCNAGGAGKWTKAYSEALRRAEVVVVADRDEPGRKHAEEVRRSLEAAGARSVTVVEPAEGKDAADHLAAGLTVDEFVPVDVPEEPRDAARAAETVTATLPAQDTGELLATVEAFIRRFVVLRGAASYLTVALYVLHTWAVDAAHATPYLNVESPEKQSGKTRLLEVLEFVCRNPIKVASITAAALFQSIADGKPTLMIDEADAIFAGNTERYEELRGVLNAGNAPGSVVIRGGKDGKPTRYPVFCPKVIAGIATGKLPDTIRDRSIVVRMDRKLKSERVERLRRRRVQNDMEELRARLQAWAAQNTPALERFELDEPIEKLSDRMEEAWEPLLAIADLAGRDHYERALTAALDLSEADAEDASGSTSHKVLFHVREVFGHKDAMHSVVIAKKLNENDELGYQNWNDGKGIRPFELARLLSPYYIRPKQIRIGDKNAKGYERDWFREAWERYGSDSSETPETSQCSRANPGISGPKHDPGCFGSENGENPRPVRDVSGVSPETAPTAPGEEKPPVEQLFDEPDLGAGEPPGGALDDDEQAIFEQLLRDREERGREGDR